MYMRRLSHVRIRLWTREEERWTRLQGAEIRLLGY